MTAIRRLVMTPASLFALFVAVSMIALDFASVALKRSSVVVFQIWVYLFYALTVVALAGALMLVLRRRGGARYILAIVLCALIHLVLALPGDLAPGRLLAQLITG